MAARPSEPTVNRVTSHGCGRSRRISIDNCCFRFTWVGFSQGQTHRSVPWLSILKSADRHFISTRQTLVFRSSGDGTYCTGNFSVSERPIVSPSGTGSPRLAT